MLDCMIVGDSIAVGVATVRTECVSYSRGGWNTWQWNRDYLKTVSKESTNTLIISLGSNDHSGVKTESELRKMRHSVTAKRVFWILPYGNLKASNVDIQSIRDIIQKIASEHGDTLVPITDISADKIHPTGKGYKELAGKTK